VLYVVANGLTVFADIEHDILLDLDGAAGRQGPHLDVQTISSFIVAGSSWREGFIRESIVNSFSIGQ
jgi:hypothetical protein